MVYLILLFQNFSHTHIAILYIHILFFGWFVIACVIVSFRSAKFSSLSKRIGCWLIMPIRLPIQLLPGFFESGLLSDNSLLEFSAD
jgi:hypothetical protein